MSSQPILAHYIEQRQSLPITQIKEAFIEALNTHQVIILTGSTGSGKTTQIPQYILDSKIGQRIVVTQPRRVAAISLAKRISLEHGSELGEDVGYAVRFDIKRTPSTKILVATDGILLKEISNDATLSHYDVIVLDEVHTRSLNTDLLLGIVKEALKKRKDLKVVIMSATLLPEKFAKFFPGSCHIEAPGNSHEVSVEYRDASESLIKAVADEVMNIAKNGPKDLLNDAEEFIASNILVFLSGEEEIRNVEEELKSRLEHQSLAIPLAILKVYGAMRDSDQQLIFTRTPAFTRRVILATNIAETSITIPNIVYVIDSGFHKIKRFDPISKRSALLRWPAAKANLAQRAGRAGRVAPGLAVRLFPEEVYNDLPEESPPEILRSDATGLVLSLLSLNFNPFDFNFLDAPSETSMKEAFKELLMHKCLKGTKLTHKGHFCAAMPLSVPESLSLYRAAELRVTDEIAKIVALISSPQIFDPNSTWKEFTAKLRVFRVKNSDHLSFLKIVESFLLMLNERELHSTPRETEASMKDWCQEHSLHLSSFLALRSTISQILKEVDKFKIKIDPQASTLSRDERIKLSLLNGFALSCAIKRVEKADNLISDYYVALATNAKVGLAKSPFADSERPDFLFFSDLFCNADRTEMKFITEISAKMFYNESKDIYKYYANKHCSDSIREELRSAVFENEAKSRRK